MYPAIANIILLLCISVNADTNSILSDDFINSINNLQTTWTAGRNFPETVTVDELKKLGGAYRPDPEFYAKHQIRKGVRNGTIPESFDGRTIWTNCESLTQIRDQGACGSCWAYGAAAAITDRVCIHSNGLKKINFSTEDLVTCCPLCGDCSGGAGFMAWDYWIRHGLVSGGDYGSNEGCKPYSQGSYENAPPTTCVQECQANYTKTYEEDKDFGTNYYFIYPSVEEIQLEIMTNGPVETFLEIWEDLYSYKSGVYRHVTGNYTANHLVKVIGWGVEDTTPYWLISNSWGTDWGDQGFLKFIRGENHLWIESFINAGMP